MALAGTAAAGIAGLVIRAGKGRFGRAISIDIAELGAAETAATLGTARAGNRLAHLAILGENATIGTLYAAVRANGTVIALLAKRALDDAIAALLDVTRCAAAVITDVIGLLAGFISFKNAIAAQLAHARRAAGSPEITPVVRSIARLARIKPSVSAK